MPTIRGVLRGAPCPGHPANQTYQTKEARHLTEEAPEASDLQMPEGRSVNVNAPQPAKEALHPSEQDCRIIVDSIPGHVVTLTAHGDIEFVNQQWLDYLGKTLDELKSWTNCGVVHPDDLSRVVSTWNRSVETGQPYDSECRFCRADGVFRWFHVRIIPEREAEGRIVRWYGLHTDIDERKQAEDRLQLLLDVTNQVVSNLQIDDLLRAISASVRRVMQCDVVYVCLPRSDVNRLRVFVLDFPESKGFIREDSISIEGSIAGIVFRTAKPWMGNAGDLLQLGVKDDPGIAEGLNTGCVLPLINGNHVLGVLALGSREDHGFTQVDFGFLIQVANQIAIAIENSSAYHESTSARAYLEECLEEIQSLKDRLQDENLVLREQIWNVREPLNPAKKHLIAVLRDEIRQPEKQPLRLTIPREERLARVADALLDDVGDDRTLDDWAHIAGMVRRTFMRAFSAQVGHT